MKSKEESARDYNRRIITLCGSFLKLELAVLGGRASDEEKENLTKIKSKVLQEGLTFNEARKIAASDFAKTYIK